MVGNSFKFLLHFITLGMKLTSRNSSMVSMAACYCEVPGSNPGKGENLINFWLKKKFNSFEFEYHQSIGLGTNWTSIKPGSTLNKARIM